MKKVISILIFLSVLGSLSVGAFAMPPFNEDSKARAEAAESVLLLSCYDSNNELVSTGSGFLAFEDGIIVTNYHVIDEDVRTIQANTEDGMYFDINEVLCTDRNADIAILKTKARTRLPVLTLGDSDNVNKGTKVVAIGSPLGILNIVTEGIYSGQIFDEADYILFSAAISSGSSGGALFNDAGEVIGITAASYSKGQNLNLAVPINKAIELWNSYQNGTYRPEENAVEEAEPSEYAAPDNAGEEEYLIGKKIYDKGNYTEAVEWFRKGAEKGYPDAQTSLGDCYYEGKGVQEDYTAALEWFKKAAEQGDSYGFISIGTCYYEGKGVAQDYTKAVDWYRKAAEQGDALGQCSLGSRYYNGEGVAQDYTKAVDWYRKAAEQGDALGQYCLGYCYYNGEGVAQDYSKAVEWYRKAAEQGNAYAQNGLGICYYNGNGVTKDFSKAAEWYTKAAEQDYPWGLYNLGYLFSHGIGVTADFKIAEALIIKAANKGLLDAQYYLGWSYQHGIATGVQTDYYKAVEWYTKAAEQGHAGAQCALGVCYYFGYGVNKNYIEAAKWFEKASQQDSAEASYRLAQCYEYGNGVEQDKQKAKELFEKAEQLGYRD